MEDGLPVKPLRGVDLRLNQALSRLRPHDLDVLLLQFVEGLSQEEVTIALNISDATTKERTARALAGLQYHLAQAGEVLTGIAVRAMLTESLVMPAPTELAAAILKAITENNGLD